MSSAAAAVAAEAPNEKHQVQICKGINGLEKVVLRDIRGSSVEVLPLRYFIVFAESATATSPYGFFYVFLVMLQG